MSGKIEQDIFRASSKFTLWLLYVTLLVLHSAQTLSLTSFSRIQHAVDLSPPITKCKNINVAITD